MSVDAINAITTALAIVKKLRDVSERMKDAEVKLLIADLSIELANAKQAQAELLEEVTELKGQVRALTQGVADPCPRCRKPTWAVQSSKPARHMGELGVVDRVYLCSACAFTETHTEVPGDVSGTGRRRPR